MGVVNYTARRSLIDGTLPLESITLALGVMRFDERTRVVRTDTPADDGTTQSVLRRIETYYEVETTVSYESDLADLRMFRDSVSGGEAFEISPLGQVGAPGVLFEVKLASKSIALERLRPGAYRMSFEVRATGNVTIGAGIRTAPTSFLRNTAADYVSIPSADIKTLFDGASDVCVSWWARMSTVSTNRYLLWRQDGGTQFMARFSTDRINMGWFSISRGSTYFYVDNFNPADGLWHHYSSQFNAGVGEQLYIDGVAATRVAGTVPLTLGASDGDIIVGRHEVDIAEVAIYRDQGFQPADVANLRNVLGSPNYYNRLNNTAGLNVVGSPQVIVE